MLEELKVMLGDRATNYSDALLGILLKAAMAEVEAYTNRNLDYELEMICLRIAIIKLNQFGAEGLSSQSFSGVSESFIDGYPQDILSVLNRKRRLRVL